MRKDLYITENHECCSLLKPNFNWLERFDYGSLFNINQKIEVETLSLDSIAKFRDVRVDALKIDKGNELPILREPNPFSMTYSSELESGLHKNYEKETTFDQLCSYLIPKGFTCMEVFTQLDPKTQKSGT